MSVFKRNTNLHTSYAPGPGPSLFWSLNLLSLVTISPPFLLMVSLVLYAPGPENRKVSQFYIQQTSLYIPDTIPVYIDKKHIGHYLIF